MGVWIETVAVNWCNNALIVTPCMGVWIETRTPLELTPTCHVTPCMGVWIETLYIRYSHTYLMSHPVWVCGLKHKGAEKTLNS